MTTETFLDTPHSIADAPSKSYREILALAQKATRYRKARIKLLADIAAKHQQQSRRVIPDLGFHFNPEENYRIHLAKRHAAQFMETYGNAAPRANQKQIDLTHYIQ